MGIENLRESIPKVVSDLAPAVILGAGGLWILTKVGSHVAECVRQKRILNKWKETPKDVVILHQFPRGKTAPNPSPFCLKLETYLRMSNISYQSDFDYPWGPKGKTPWITLNGEHIADSELIINFLAEKFNKKLGSYNDQQRAVGTLARIAAEEYLYWGLAMWRYVYSKTADLKQVFDMPAWALSAFQRTVSKRVIQASSSQGLGRHSQEDINEFMKKTLRSLSLILDNRKFFLGDEPSEVDCTIFGILAQFLWCLPGAPFSQFINDEVPNLMAYSIRMKEHFWPDWDKCVAGAHVQLSTSS